MFAERRLHCSSLRQIQCRMYANVASFRSHPLDYYMHATIETHGSSCVLFTWLCKKHTATLSTLSALSFSAILFSSASAKSGALIESLCEQEEGAREGRTRERCRLSLESLGCLWCGSSLGGPDQTWRPCNHNQVMFCVLRQYNMHADTRGVWGNTPRLRGALQIA